MSARCTAIARRCALLGATGSAARRCARPRSHRERRSARMSSSRLAPRRDPQRRRDARALVSQPRSGRRADRARPFPRRLPARQVAALRRTPSRPISRGKTVLDIGCNAGFYSHRDEAARRRARARHRLRRRLPGAGALRRRGARRSTSSSASSSVYDVGALGERFDLVLFMGVLYHLRHPLLALDLIHEHVVARPAGLPVACSAAAPTVEPRRRRLPVLGDGDLRRARLSEAALRRAPLRAAIRTNWWVPNRACAEAMLRSAGLRDRRASRGGGLHLPPRDAARRGAAPSIRAQRRSAR